MARAAYSAGVGQHIDPAWEATFIPIDPPRGSWFALWNPEQPGAVFGSDLKTAEVDVVLPGPNGPSPVPVTAARLPLRDGIDLLAQLPASADVRPSVAAWSAVVRSGLDLIARGRMLPWVSPAGWDTWRVDPLDGADLLHVEALSRALPAFAHCLPSESADAATEPRIIDPEHLVRDCFDAIGDRLIRAPASARLATSPVFAELQPTRVRHLRPWVADVAGPLCRNAGLSLQALPPAAMVAAPDEGMVEDPQAPWRIRFRLRSQRDPSLVIDAAELWQAPVEVMRTLGDQVDIDLLSGLQRAAVICPLFAPSLSEDKPVELLLPAADLDEFLDRIDDLEAAGIDTRWPADLVSADVERRLVVGTSAPGDNLPTVNDLASLLDVNWEFLLDGTPLTTDELSVLADAKRAIVPFRGRWVRLTARSRQQLRAPAPEVAPTDLLAAALGEGLDLSNLSAVGSLGPLGSDVVGVQPVGGFAQLIHGLKELVRGRQEPEPVGLEAVLRPYQQRGLAWMADLASLGLGGCLADDMGLGKTIQLLSLHQLRSGRTLVVCPTSLLANWEREAARFLPGTTVRRYHGPNRTLDNLGSDDLLITTYGVVRSDAEALAEVEWDLFVADEAQNAKNPRSRTARALRQIPAHSRLALTGTPVENRLTELWSIIDWCLPGLLGPLERFRRDVALPIERDNNEEAAKRLATLIDPFVLRRVKTDPAIAPELPPKTERDVVVPLTPEQVTLYQATTKEALFDLAQNAGKVRHGLILRMLTALKQITNHPAQYLGEAGPLAGRSGKLEALDQLLDQAHVNGESTLVFSQYVTMGQLIIDHLTERGVKADILHGGLSVPARQVLVDRFQAGELPVLMLSLKAGGTGLNLTKATQVIHFDRWWNPAVEDQATDRAYRIGQDRPVAVHRLITEGTVEDRIAALLTQKRQLADRVVGSGEGWLSSLDDNDLAALVELDDRS